MMREDPPRVARSQELAGAHGVIILPITGNASPLYWGKPLL
jgi:hypothetical protein